ncbi:MAG: cytochrome c biogenesis protein CcsA [Cytophagales bacterium]|nr:cytochrome c biogenesis protein CcsA [Bernardetiaceae bacterium]MDW8209740.1 cytochrome c biogenesis protein CcsA [Cytophagales bacterium]
MIHTTVGVIGHVSVCTAFVASLLAAYGYIQSQHRTAVERQSWMVFARRAFYLHSAAVLSVIISLFYIIYNHYYEYHYAWDHSSNNLPVHFMISCFWEGQEGSFLLWIFWHVLIGLVLMHTAKTWEADVMTVFALVQAFLVSMILGVVLVGEWKIGSSPFMLLREARPNDPIFQINPNFVPSDGSGLNPLLQNYWMVIHPPTLFLGFAGTLVPFAYAIAALRTGRYKEWIALSLPWMHATALVLGLGIMMGAYWAYETLNFGGYWNWDPVENAVYVPWLLLVASTHVMIVVQRSNTALKTAFVLVIATFLSILYATFLTRSGILGNASVHSFTDLGLSGQLMVYLLAFLAISVFYLARAWKKIPTSQEEISIYSREFWIFVGATTLCLAGFQVIVPTSIPVYNKLLELFGIQSNLAPPADQVAFYTKFQLWFGVAIALLSGTGQFFFWKTINSKTVGQAFTLPLTITMLLAAVVMVGAKINNWKHVILLTAGIYSIVANGFILSKLIKARTWRLSAGAVAHIGVAMMLLGILASAGYSKVISLNTTGLLYNRQFSEEMNKNHLLLFLHQPQRMKDYILTYKGTRLTSRDFPGYIDRNALQPTGTPWLMVAKEDLTYKGKTYFTKGDTINVYHQNTYYEIEYKKANGRTFTLYPRIQFNEQMGSGGLVPSPDISRWIDRDLYTHITNIPDPEQERKWSKPEKFVLSVGDTFIVNDYVAIFDDVRRGQPIDDEDINVFARIRILDRNQYYEAKPAYLIKGQMVRKIPYVNMDIGVKLLIDEIRPQENAFVIQASTTQKDWIILKAIEMPLINLLWTGTLLVAIGFGIAAYRRYKDINRKMRAPNLAQEPLQSTQKAG